MSRVTSLHRAISENVRNVAERIRDDNLESAKEEAEKRRTRLGREMTNLGLEEAVRIATYKSENAELLKQKRREMEAASAAELEEIKRQQAIELERVITGAAKGEEGIPPPDKGYAWVMALAGFMLLFATWGSNGAYGVFLSYWLNNSTFPGAGAKDYALIGSMVLCLAQSLAPFTQMLSAILGIKPVMTVGVGLHFLGYMLCSYCDKLWQLYLTQGFLVGLGFALVFNPLNTLMPEWFDKKRGISSGIIVSASGVGGVIFSLASQSLIDQTGEFRWSVRMIAFICLAFEVVLTLLAKPRIPKHRLKSVAEIKTRASVLFNFKILNLWYVHSITVWFLLILGCYIISLFSLSAYCTFMGFSQKVGSDMTAIFNGCQAIGRFSIGLASDHTGRVNLALVLNVVMIVLIFAMWINSFSYNCILFYSILSGLSFGSASTLNQPIMADQVEPELFPSAWSYENFFMGVWSLVVELIALELRDQGKKRPFIRAQICAGFFATGGIFFLIPIRELKIRLFLQKRLAATDAALMDKDAELTTEGRALFEKRKVHYIAILRPGIHAYLHRLVYPIRV
ncbi:DEKNAAC104884 [Brettanomyces naardenensis]|uniref:DEKNAAC104884 n=1 Tax=Brettanomyces naardenensis TaxID=13370 RepID=A0A448YS90_BRENA|nr:DEKNAAC104884 [Brettanomyces naardenensis]